MPLNTQSDLVRGLEGTEGTSDRLYHSAKEVIFDRDPFLARPWSADQIASSPRAQSIYALPADNAENDRLEKQHRLILHLFGGPIGAVEVERLLQEQKGARVLDVGCGPGSWIKVEHSSPATHVPSLNSPPFSEKQVADLYPTCEAYATDFASTYKAASQGSAAHVDFRKGDVLKRLPYEDGFFDFIQMRFFTGALKVKLQRHFLFHT